MFPRFVLVIILALCIASLCRHDNQKATGKPVKKPVIIDTDIGSFLDDSFAIVYAIQSQELDVKLIVTCSGNTTARAKVLARLLRGIGRDEIPIGVGVADNSQTYEEALFPLAENEDLSNYRGGFFQDGIGEMGNIINSNFKVNNEPIDIIAIGPMTNFPRLLSQFPDSVNRSTIKVMAGSFKKGYNDSDVPASEYNVRLCISCMQAVLESGWKITITPLDTCGTMVMRAPELSRVLETENKASYLLSSSLLYYCINNDKILCDLRSKTPILYDTVAVLTALPGEISEATQLLNYQSIKVSVNGTGFTVRDDTRGALVNVALYWNNDGRTKFMESFTSILAKIIM